MSKMTSVEFRMRKGQKPLTMVTCYDFWSAQMLNTSSLDALLVGDSVAMVMHGHPHTLMATTEMMALHTAAVIKGAPDKFTVTDFPFLSSQTSMEEGMKTAAALMRAGAHALKLEGTEGHLELIQRLSSSGVPIMGHIGLTPQSVHGLGGYKVQGRDLATSKKLLQQAKALEEAGCFSVVLECIPKALGKEITQELKIPTIGIGAGAETDGQILVLQDLLGMQNQKAPKFVRAFLPGHDLALKAVEAYAEQVREKKFPDEKESYL